MSDNVVIHSLAGDYQAWDTPLAGAGVDFSPFFSLTSPEKIPQKDDFSPAEVSVVSQAQAKNEDWQVFDAPHEEASFSAAVEDGVGESPQMMSAGQAEGYDAGYQDGYDKGFALGQSEGETKGIEAGQQQTQALEEQRNQDMKVALGHLAQVTETLSDELLQPMQTLALHLAKQLVRGELSLSSKAIERLIMLSMEQLQITQSTIQVHMNPFEFERLQQHNGLPDQVVLQPSKDVSMGSVKVEHADSWVEDLMEDRLAQISQQAFGFVDKKFVDPIQEIEPEIEPEIESEIEPEIKSEVESEIEPEIKSEMESELKPEIELESEMEPKDLQDLSAEPAQEQAEAPELNEQQDTELATDDLEEVLEADALLTGVPDEHLKSPTEDD
ncbi:FliH/SctL family protein [Candidatus Njordibacter sp. Uisw_039]|uniref:FliH/SctL family protein n=1 Tax=Candidatus Njordibacter sp. Uisw_039 TaxID=3230972 RepID=UPI003D43726A